MKEAMKSVVNAIISFKNSENSIKMTANMIFLTLSVILLGNMLNQLSGSLFWKVFYWVAAIGFELLIQYIIGLAKAFWSLGGWRCGGWKNKRNSLILWIIYAGYMSMVVTASVGFTLSEVTFKSNISAVYNLQKSSIIDNISKNTNEIALLDKARQPIDPTMWKFKELSGRIDMLQKANKGLFLSLTNYKEVQTDLQKDVFEVLGSSINRDGNFVKLWILLVLGLMIQVGLLLTSWTVKIPSKRVIETSKVIELPKRTQAELFIIKNKDKLLKVIDNLFTEGQGYLNGEGRIATMTGFSVGECRKIKNYLAEIYKDGVALIDNTQGSSKANFSLEVMKSRILEIA